MSGTTTDFSASLALSFESRLLIAAGRGRIWRSFGAVFNRPSPAAQNHFSAMATHPSGSVDSGALAGMYRVYINRRRSSLLQKVVRLGDIDAVEARSEFELAAPVRYNWK